MIDQDRGGFKARDGGREQERGGFRDRDRGQTQDRDDNKGRDRSWDKDKTAAGFKPRVDDQEKPQRDNKYYDRKKVMFDDTTNRPVFRKKDTEDDQTQKREFFDFKKRKSENTDEVPGAERRVNKVFIARKHPTKSDGSDINTNSDKE